MKYLSETFWRYSWDVGTLVKIILNFIYVCQYVCLLTSLLKFDKYRDISSSEYLYDFFGDILGMMKH